MDRSEIPIVNLEPDNLPVASIKLKSRKLNMDDQPIRSQKKTFEELLEKELKGTE